MSRSILVNSLSIKGRLVPFTPASGLYHMIRHITANQSVSVHYEFTQSQEDRAQWVECLPNRYIDLFGPQHLNKGRGRRVGSSRSFLAV